MDPEPSSLLITFQSIDFSIIGGFTLLFFLLICSALISGAEVALFSLTRSDIEQDNGVQSRRIQIISELLERPKKLLATILIANNFINIAIVILFAYLGDFLFTSITSDVLRFIVEVVVVH